MQAGALLAKEHRRAELRRTSSAVISRAGASKNKAGKVTARSKRRLRLAEYSWLYLHFTPGVHCPYFLISVFAQTKTV